MIEINGTAYPLESGRTYLLTVNRHTTSDEQLRELVKIARERLNIFLLVITVLGDPAAAINIRGPIQIDPVVGGGQ